MYRRVLLSKCWGGIDLVGDLMSKIALVDNDRNVLNAVGTALDAEGYCTQIYCNSAEALEDLRESVADAAIVNMKMPNMGGVELLRQLRETSTMPVIFLSSSVQEIDELLALRMGADDFVRKPFSEHILLERLKVVLRRVTIAETAAMNDNKAGVIKHGDLLIDPQRYSCAWKGNRFTLTVTELRILQALARQPGVVKSRNAIMDAAYGEGIYVDDRTIDGHVKRLRTKFESVDAGFISIDTVYGLGYRFVEG